MLAVARTAENYGFGAFFRSDHYPRMGSASGLPGYTDAWITIAELAREASSIRLGTPVSPVTFRAVGTFVVIATQVDQMSGGRVEVGVGAGWYEPENKAYGLPFLPVDSRYDLFEDQFTILHAVWSAPPGTTFEYTGLRCAVSLQADTLRPVRRPHPPIVLGGAGGLDRRAWPQRSPKYNTSFRRVAETRRIHDAVRRSCEGGGRDPSTIVWSAGQVSGGGCNEGHRRAPRIQNSIAEGTKRHAKAPALGLCWDSVEVRMGSSSRSGRVVPTPNSSPPPGRRAIVIAMGSASCADEQARSMRLLESPSRRARDAKVFARFLQR